jgi:hypothetical protein
MNGLTLPEHFSESQIPFDTLSRRADDAQRRFTIVIGEAGLEHAFNAIGETISERLYVEGSRSHRAVRLLAFAGQVYMGELRVR